MSLNKTKYLIYDVLVYFRFHGRGYRVGEKFQPEHIACSERELRELISLGRIQLEAA
jgi:hypothetical protein